ncbi:YchJ family protein [Sinomonas sp. ASV322]|uniref:YchJ family protein n=1 Tax=Sinomonas sp. ASV322 TaxID=3041920 RepID=UPI0027DB790B|nr:YchJ family protein [Sinomonas sp. ASV322]MDQ4502926.1 YchJ family protein [Sinomonas sp. ASV322]
MTLDPGARCPCGTGETYGACCGRYHAGQTAPTAEALMRSRYSAFAVGDRDYLVATWHPSTRPAVLELDGRTQWRRLDVVRTEAGGPFDDRGVVEFEARYADDDGRGVLRETSRFVREGGRWFYLDAV